MIFLSAAIHGAENLQQSLSHSLTSERPEINSDRRGWTLFSHDRHILHVGFRNQEGRITYAIDWRDFGTLSLVFHIIYAHLESGFTGLRTTAISAA